MRKVKNLLDFEAIVSVDGKLYYVETKVRDLVEVVAPMEINATVIPDLRDVEDYFSEGDEGDRRPDNNVIYWDPLKKTFNVIIEGAKLDPGWKYLGFSEFRGI